MSIHFLLVKQGARDTWWWCAAAAGREEGCGVMQAPKLGAAGKTKVANSD